MRGHVLTYKISERAGVITGDDGVRYSFARADWNDSRTPEAWTPVDFVPTELVAKTIYVVPKRAIGGSGGAQSEGRAGNDFADILLFRRMCTPAILHVCFWFGAVMCLVSGAYQAMNRYSGMMEGILTMLVGPLVVRVACEILFVPFRILECAQKQSAQAEKALNQPVPESQSAK